jgi:uncharacterized protein YbbC (DUF1343 family)
MKHFLFSFLVCSFLFQSIQAQKYASNVIVGADQMSEYMPLLKGKRVALLVNQTSRVGKVHLADKMKVSGVKLSVIFAPEHGFRGKADAGAHVKNGVDTKTGVRILSLYGKNKKPTATQLKNVDVVVFDIQDVGARFYTYISSLQYMMEACAENNKKLIILDRPNPNGFYVDGPVLNKKYKSFVGMQAIPIVHGMTVGEYANMLNGEGWLKNKVKANVTIIRCKKWDHSMLYDLPVAPSPNLRSKQSILLYPSLCLFEGTEVSVGRGTDNPFTAWGHPEYSKHRKYAFTPKPGFGSKNPKHKYKKCYGQQLDIPVPQIIQTIKGKFFLGFIQTAYSSSSRRDGFFTSFFEKLAGTNELRKQIMAKKSETQIRASWEPALSKFKKIRKRYLLYPDFK